METQQQDKKHYTPFGRALRGLYRFGNPAWKCAPMDSLPRGAVYVIHHQNMFGPVRAIGLLPRDMHMWSLECFFDREACYDQFYRYTFTERFGWPKPFAQGLAGLLSVLVPAVLRSFGGIAVRRGDASLTSIRESLALLANGEDIAICPNKDYASTSPAIGEMYTGFLMLGVLHHRQTGKDLPFIPVHVSRARSRIVFADPIYLNPALSFKEIQEQVPAQVAASQHALARECGDLEG